jgi:hypothetical protein
MLPVRVTPLILFIARLFRLVILAGIKTPADDPPKYRFDTADVIRLPGVPAMVGPFNVSDLAPTVKVPAVRVRVPLSDKFAPNMIFRLVLKLFIPPDIAFNVISVPVPNVKFDVTPPVSVPAP